jgi:hypothetical protein
MLANNNVKVKFHNPSKNYLRLFRFVVIEKNLIKARYIKIHRVAVVFYFFLIFVTTVAALFVSHALMPDCRLACIAKHP